MTFAGTMLVFFGGVADTLRRGASNVGLPSSTLVGAILALLLLLGGALIGVLRVIHGLELVGTSADAGHLYAVVLAALALLFGAAAWAYDPSLGLGPRQGAA